MDQSGQHYRVHQLYLVITTTGGHDNECWKGSTGQLHKVHQQDIIDQLQHYQRVDQEH